MTRQICARMVLKLAVTLTFVSSSYGNAMGPSCSLLKRVEIHYKGYYEFYLGLQDSTYVGLFYDMINQAVNLCCSTSTVEFIPIQEKDKSVEEILVDTVKVDRGGPEDGVLKLFYPEFADKTSLDIYDSTTPFIRLSKSPGHAVLMVKPDPKEPVFVGEIIVKSWAILIFLITFAWFVGILAWMSDHRVNPNDFPSPFYIGMFEGFWWSVVTMTTVGYGDKAPKGIIARILAIVWIMISTVFLALFTANATSILAISQKEEDHSITLGKSVGVLNSKHFVEVELNLGSTVIEYSSMIEWAAAARKDSEVDRLIFPNYMDFLLFVKHETYKKLFTNAFVLTNAVKYPFQIGMAFAAKNDNMTVVEERFLQCMRYELPTLERQARKNVDYSTIEFTENTQTKKLKTALDGDNLLLMSYYFFGIIGLFVCIGLGWDFWVYRKATSGSDSTQASDAEMSEGTHAEFDDIGHGSGNLVPGHSSPNMGYKMSIADSYGAPPASQM